MVNQERYSSYHAAAFHPASVTAMLGRWRTRTSGIGRWSAGFVGEETATEPSIYGRMKNPNLSPSAVARADRPDQWRSDMGGHDPATPMAEALINYHNHTVAWMVPVVFMVAHMCRILMM
eukprot:GHVS01047182.1.p1 GENE.GHVS01047182.1~~GHVS01047182.1.p1  ORF type:complete len:120 (-),score=4.66 GHVS01047182.1:307-666(-)